MLFDLRELSDGNALKGVVILEQGVSVLYLGPLLSVRAEPPWRSLEKPSTCLQAGTIRSRISIS